MGIPEEEKGWKEAVEMFKIIEAEKFTNFLSDTKPGSSQNIEQDNSKISTPTHFKIKLQNIKDKQKAFKEAMGGYLIHIVTRIRNTSVLRFYSSKKKMEANI